ncbi:glutathione S-transferase family protein [Roseomonas frigidaquae]|uniref:Glutathione S-transferase family protein n=1 Tax=Falsiroseomonas frigidaquae TaxID=487318 RepID=A0ABX1EXU0_9PROT|nr:glutathione S-transferase family protein [Falsiroseomonas frigidaquae]NKE44912.1 glutathione S-transferase family protein [Falsiroseomonas frigidaquae]
MAEGRLVIGTKRYSSWSLRGWLMVHLAQLDVEEVVVPLAGGGNTQAIKAISPNALVPYLEHRGARVWESLSIAEYCAEFKADLWPRNRSARAHARSIASEMHAGFRGLRMAMPMNLGRDFAGHGRNPDSLADIARIEAIWAEALGQYGGSFLMGADFGLVDAMYAPVVARFITWKPEITSASQAYCDAVRAHPLVDRWYREAAAEPAEWLLPKYESPAL